MEKPYAVVFAGVPGTSKTPIANYLSCEFGLPILNTDQIRYEVQEDLRLNSINAAGGVEEYEKRREQRIEKVIARKQSFIYDGSMDRRWSEVKPQLAQAGYGWFMINLELTKPFLLELYRSTGRNEWAQAHLDDYLKQHTDFLARFKSDVHVEIGDSDFVNRLAVAANGLKDFLQAHES